jgi:hypothetical protein
MRVRILYLKYRNTIQISKLRLSFLSAFSTNVCLSKTQLEFVFLDILYEMLNNKKGY